MGAAPGEFILQLHARPTAAFRRLLVRPISVSRHPLDGLISILQFASPEAGSECWLDGDRGEESALVDAAPTDEAFRAMRSGRGRRRCSR